MESRQRHSSRQFMPRAMPRIRRRSGRADRSRPLHGRTSSRGVACLTWMLAGATSASSRPHGAGMGWLGNRLRRDMASKKPRADAPQVAGRLGRTLGLITHLRRPLGGDELPQTRGAVDSLPSTNTLSCQRGRPMACASTDKSSQRFG